MAAPSIPNLLSLRGAGSRGRGRGASGGRGGPGGSGGGNSRGPSADAVIQNTDTDAAVSRLSAVQLGYLDDPYAASFVSGPPVRRLPIINRGTYVRTRALDMIVSAFLSQSPREGKQIISLGAGTDTRPFRLLDSHHLASSEQLIYHEIDFGTTCRRKYQVVRSTPALAAHFEDVDASEGGSWSAQWRGGRGEYHCHAADLRDLESRLGLLVGTSIRTNVPTLILSECCLCYLTHQDSERVIAFFQSRIASLALAVYEPMPLDDAFGQVMVSNLRARSIDMPSLELYRDPSGQATRLREAGFETVGHVSVREAWDGWFDSAEKARLDGLEGLDEVEEWHLLAAHYVVAWGLKRTSLGGFGSTAT